MFSLLRVLFLLLITVSGYSQNSVPREVELYVLPKNLVTKMRVSEMEIQNFSGVAVVKSSDEKLIKTLLDDKSLIGEELNIEGLDVRALFIIRGDGIGEKRIVISRTAISNEVKTIKSSKDLKIYRVVKKLAPKRLGW